MSSPRVLHRAFEFLSRLFVALRGADELCQGLHQAPDLLTVRAAALDECRAHQFRAVLDAAAWPANSLAPLYFVTNKRAVRIHG